MTSFASVSGSGLTIRLLLIGCCAGLLAGCADSQRLTDPFSDPFRGDVDRTPTGSISDPQPQAYAPTQPVKSRPLPATDSRPSTSSYSSAAPAYTGSQVASRGWSGSDTAGRAVHPSSAGWTAEGGMPIVVAEGETADVIARRYGIPTDALVRTNGYATAGDIRPGARIVIPTYNAALAASSGVRFSTARNEQSRTQERIHEAHLHVVRGPTPAEERHDRAAEIKAERLAREKRQKKVPLASARLTKPHPHSQANAAPVPRVYAEAPRAPVDHMSTGKLEPAEQSAALSNYGQNPLAGARPDHGGLSPRRQRRHQHRFAGGHIGQGGRGGNCRLRRQRSARLWQSRAHPSFQRFRHGLCEQWRTRRPAGRNGSARPGDRQIRRNRQCDCAAAPFRSPQGHDAGRSDPISRRALIRRRPQAEGIANLYKFGGSARACSGKVDRLFRSGHAPAL